MLYTIYLLIDPRNGEIRYVGATYQNTATRLSAHLCELGSKRKRAWIKELRAEGLKPKIEKLFTCRLSQEAARREAVWIRRLRKAGCDLLNGVSTAPYIHNHWLSTPICSAVKREVLKNVRDRDLSWIDLCDGGSEDVELQPPIHL